ncbi:hypothetical protein [Luteimonas sp. R10]|uniref:hypothetical protein n=1 Tax=Luteimonas sp. R10 TaxID=3108176 RepID=UPI003089CE82|nr:hypothetical protein U3649_04690 [Luteimonas sp. R10]
MPDRSAFALPIAALVLACAACSPPEQPVPEQPPEPQATQLRDAVQAPLEKARAVEDAVREADEHRRAQLDANDG